jgi:twitching motility protein PilT
MTDIYTNFIQSEDEPVDEFDEQFIAPEEDPDRDYSVFLEGIEVITEKDDLDVEGLFRYAATQECSDIHLHPGSPPKLRVHGELQSVEGIRNLTSSDTDLARQETMSDADFGAFSEAVYSHVYAYEIPGVARFRIIVAMSMGSLTLVARKLVDDPPSFDDLNTLDVIRDLSNLSSGLIIVSGITGSGKSTLMAAMILAINQSRAVSIVSLEEPVEILHKDIKANIIQRSVGTDVPSFEQGVQDALRQDPDVILIGEIRDPKTAQAALQAAMSGHLVITTLHAMTSVASIGRMLDMFAGEELKSVKNRFSEVLRGIVSQKLVPSTEESGGRIPVNEILLNTDVMKKALEQNLEPTQLRELLENSSKVGMQTFEQHFKHLVSENLVDEKIALAQSSYPEQMKEMLAEIGKVPVQEENEFILDNGEEMSFSERVKAEEKANGIVIKPSGAAPILPKAPVRPNRYFPRKIN